MKKELILRLYGENVPLDAIASLVKTTPKEIIKIVHFDMTKDLGTIQLDNIIRNKNKYLRSLKTS